MTYKMWEEAANQYMVKKWGLGIDDIPDMPWYDWFTSEMTPEEAAEEAIEKVNNDGW